MKKFLFYGLTIILSLVFINYADALCVKAPVANLREGPGTKYRKVWQVFKYMPFKKLSRKGKWYKVEDCEGDKFWIYGNLVTSKMDCAVVKVDEANIRSGPGTNFEKKDFGPAIKFDSYKILKRQGAWVKVMDDYGNSGWIFKKLLWVQ